MKENLHGGYELSLHGPDRDDGCGTAPSLDAISSLLSPADRLPARVWTVSSRVDDLAPRQGSPLPAVASELPLPRCDESTEIAHPRLIRRMVATIRLWRRRVRSRQQLRDLNDHSLKDIGLSRDAVAYEVAKPFWR
jgi:uncharacterized protein YjiS (DUF1127 family)